MNKTMSNIAFHFSSIIIHFIGGSAISAHAMTPLYSDRGVSITKFNSIVASLRQIQMDDN